MFDSMASIVGLLALGCAAAFVFWKGGPAERGGMALIIFSWLGMLAAQAVTREVVPDIPFLVSDVILSLGFLVLAVRFGSLWLGLAMLVQATLFVLHLLRFGDELTQGRRYLLCVNMLSYCVLLIVVLGAAASWRRRVRAHADAARRPSPIGVK
jgi:hypothetical protein